MGNCHSGLSFANPARAALIAGFALLASANGWAALPSAPTLNAPSNGLTNWLFNVGTSGARDTFAWSSVSGATSYEFVLSKQSNFSNYSEASATCASGCIAVTATTPSAGAAKFAGFVFESATYYWKVRAVSSSGRGTWSQVRSFTTTNRTNVVSQAMSYSAAPQSRVDRTDGGTVTWLTELDASTLNDNVDYKLLNNAYTIYGMAPAPRNLGTTISPTKLRSDMDAALTRSGGWAPAERDKLIDRIAATFVPASLTRNGMLSTLGIRTQCKEFADRMVIAGGGTPRNYPTTTEYQQPGRLDARPGMYVFWKRNQHAAIINAVVFDANGSVFAHLSEANWGNTWGSNPVGQVPWQRIVAHRRSDGAPVQITATGDYRAYLN